jgi:hypothetical protein
MEVTTMSSLANDTPRKRGDFVKIDRGAERTLRRLPLAIEAVLIRLMVEADHRTHIVPDSIRSLAEDWSMPSTTLRDHVRVLREAGEVERLADGTLRVLCYEDLTGVSGEPPTEDGGERSTAQRERSAAQGERSTAQLRAETRVKKEEGRRSTYDGRRPTSGSEGKTRTDAGRGQGGTESPTLSQGTASSSPPTAVGQIEGRLRVPESWRGTGSWERTITGNCEKAGANQDEAEIIGRRLRPRYDAHKVEPNEKVVAEELRRVREERSELDAELAEAEVEERFDTLKAAVGDLAYQLDLEAEPRYFSDDGRMVLDRESIRDAAIAILQEDAQARLHYVSWLGVRYCLKCESPREPDLFLSAVCPDCSKTATPEDRSPEWEQSRTDGLRARIERSVLSGTFLIAGDPLPEDLDEAVTDPTPSRQEEIA